jgi:hypothetical protein
LVAACATVAIAANIASASNTVRNLFRCSMGFPPSVWTLLIDIAFDGSNYRGAAIACQGDIFWGELRDYC